MTLSFDTSVVCPVLIGRETLLTSFERVFEQVKGGQGQTILISGEAGIGKSRLVTEVKARLGQEQAHFLHGQCFEQDRSLPFAPLLDLLRTMLLGASREATLRSLAPLTMEEVQAMLRAIFQLKRPVRRDFLEALYQLTEGNPFFAEEVLKSLLATGDIFYTDGLWDRKPLAELHIPRSISQAVQQRVSLLREPAREALELAAVIGKHVDFSLLQALTDWPESELMQCIDTLIAAQLLVETSSEQVVFRHALTRAAVYLGLLASKRKALHLRIGQAMERLYAHSLEVHLSELAYHFYQAQAWPQAGGEEGLRTLHAACGAGALYSCA